MPEYLAPGVVIEEVSFRAKSIEGVGTSVAAIVGPTRTGPLRGKPEVATSFADFVRMYGDLEDLDFGGSKVLNHTAIAAKAFFDNGGKQLFVVRTVGGVNGAGADGTGATAAFGRAADASSHVTFKSRFPGAQGNYTLELRWRDSENLLKFETTTGPEPGELVFLEAEGVPLAAKGTGTTVTDARFPLRSLRALVVLSADRTEYTVQSVGAGPDEYFFEALDKNGDPTPADRVIVGLNAAALATSTKLRFTRVRAKQPTSGALAAGTSAVLTLSTETDVGTFISGAGWGTLKTVYGTLNAAGTEFTVSAAPLNAGIAGAFTFNLAALAAKSESVGAVMIQRSFDLDVRSGGANGEVIYTYANLTTAPSGDGSLPSGLPSIPENRLGQLTSPISCALGSGVTGPQIVTALFALFSPAHLSPTGKAAVDGPRYIIPMTGGTDGSAPAAADYAGEADETKGSTGFAALEDIEDVSIVMCPAAAAHLTTAATAVTAWANAHQAIVSEMQKHCRKMRYRVGIVDSRQGMALSEVRDFRSNFDDSRLALYHPWVVIADPTGKRETITVPPAGFIAGVYANTDVTRGVHKPPANEPVLGALRFEQEINRFQQELLNPNGINCLRSFPGRGHRVWGGRTLSSDPEWIYLNVRRYFLYLERSIDKSTQWAVFEPNGERLWENVATAVSDFLYNEWFNGRLLGASPKEAYFVRCDRSTMTQNDIDYGRLVCLVGVAALKPAEFVVFRIGQKTADAKG